jgi:thymidine kinase
MSPREVSSEGRLEVISGSMYSGKTEELIRRVKRAEIAGQEVKVFKPEIDDRYHEENVGSHNGNDFRAEPVDTDSDYVEDMKDPGIDVVAVDEANFFDKDLVDVCRELADRGKRVIVAGTDQTFRGEPFEPMPGLMAEAEFVDKYRAICVECGKPATRNQRLIDGEPAHVDDPTIMVGAEESYEARCRNCHKVRK